MKRSFKETIIRLMILMIGLTIAHFGVTLFLLADLGTDPFNVLVQGVFRTLADRLGLEFFTHGTTHMAISFLIIIALLFIDRTYIKIGTLLCMFCGGPIIDIFNRILIFAFRTPHPLWLNIIVLSAACVILAFGMTIVIKSDAGTGPNDLVAVVASDKLHRRFGVVRIIVDASFVLTGFLLGGSVGIGTIICAGLVGPVAGFFLPYSEKGVQKALAKLSGMNI